MTCTRRCLWRACVRAVESTSCPTRFTTATTATAATAALLLPLLLLPLLIRNAAATATTKNTAITITTTIVSYTCATTMPVQHCCVVRHCTAPATTGRQSEHKITQKTVTRRPCARLVLCVCKFVLNLWSGVLQMCSGCGFAVFFCGKNTGKHTPMTNGTVV